MYQNIPNGRKKRRNERAALTRAGQLSARRIGLLSLSGTLLTQRRIGARGGAWSPDKKKWVVSVQISSAHTKRDMGRERETQRERGQVVEVGRRPELLVGKD